MALGEVFGEEKGQAETLFSLHRAATSNGEIGRVRQTISEATLVSEQRAAGAEAEAPGSSQNVPGFFSNGGGGRSGREQERWGGLNFRFCCFALPGLWPCPGREVHPAERSGVAVYLAHVGLWLLGSYVGWPPRLAMFALLLADLATHTHTHTHFCV